jgi:hypothetical protein
LASVRIAASRALTLIRCTRRSLSSELHGECLCDISSMKQGMRELRTGETCSQLPNFVALDYLTSGISVLRLARPPRPKACSCLIKYPPGWLFSHLARQPGKNRSAHPR